MIARALALNGASRVYIIGRRKEKLDEAASSSPHGNIIPLPGDVTSKESLSSMAERVKKEVGYVNLVVANAGITGPGLVGLRPDASLKEFVEHAWATSTEDFTDVFDVNVTAAYYTTLAFLALLDAGNEPGHKLGCVRSQVMVTASTASYMRQVRAGFAYSASKAGVLHLVKLLSTTLVRYGIRTNGIAPGLFPSELAAPLGAALKHRDDKEIWEEGGVRRENIPAERTGTEEDMAGTVLYLASRAGAFTNGSIVLLDGGKLAVSASGY